MTQADWEIDGVKIDQTIYFRNEVFGNFDWQPWKVGSEKTSAKFDIRILDKHYGVFEIEISHKPSGEAGQHNYTSMLHWGELTEIIRVADVRGKTLYLYSPSEGETEPFKIEIK